MFQATNETTNEQVRRLEGDKESLSLQVTVLHDQIDAQSEKIHDLEKTLEEQKKQLTNAEDLLQRVCFLLNKLTIIKLFPIKQLVTTLCFNKIILVGFYFMDFWFFL